MARALAANAVAAAVLSMLDVASIRTICSGGVSRHRRKAAPPYITIGPCSEEPDDAMGRGFGSVVEIPIHVITSGSEEQGDSRALTITAAVAALLDRELDRGGIRDDDASITVARAGAAKSGGSRSAAVTTWPPALSVSGWTVRMVEWAGTRGQVIQFEDGLIGYDTATTWRIYVRQA